MPNNCRALISSNLILPYRIKKIFFRIGQQRNFRLHYLKKILSFKVNNFKKTRLCSFNSFYKIRHRFLIIPQSSNFKK